MKLTIIALFAFAMLLATPLHAVEQKVWVVQKGDTLGQIIFTLGAEHIDVKKIHDWNPDLGTQIKEGQHIIYFTSDSPQPSVSPEQLKAQTQMILQQIADARAEQRKQTRTIVMIALAVGSLVFCSVYFMRRIRKGRSMRLSEPLINPTLPQLKEFSQQTGKQKVRMVIDLEGVGNVVCTAEMRRGHKPLVHFPSERRPVTWDKRFSKLASLLPPSSVADKETGRSSPTVH